MLVSFHLKRHMGDFVIQVTTNSRLKVLITADSGLRPLHAAGGDILGVILAQQRGHLRQDFFRWVRNLARLGGD